MRKIAPYHHRRSTDDLCECQRALMLKKTGLLEAPCAEGQTVCHRSLQCQKTTLPEYALNGTRHRIPFHGRQVPRRIYHFDQLVIYSLMEPTSRYNNLRIFNHHLRRFYPDQTIDRLYSVKLTMAFVGASNIQPFTPNHSELA